MNLRIHRNSRRGKSLDSSALIRGLCGDSQLVSFQSGVVQQVEASVVLLREVDAGNHHQHLDDGAEVFSDGVVKRSVSVRVLTEADWTEQTFRKRSSLSLRRCLTGGLSGTLGQKPD